MPPEAGASCLRIRGVMPREVGASCPPNRHMNRHSTVSESTSSRVTPACRMTPRNADPIRRARRRLDRHRGAPHAAERHRHPAPADASARGQDSDSTGRHPPLAQRTRRPPRIHHARSRAVSPGPSGPGHSATGRHSPLPCPALNPLEHRLSTRPTTGIVNKQPVGTWMAFPLRRLRSGRRTCE
jgi:hypothetical protein